MENITLGQSVDLFLGRALISQKSDTVKWYQDRLNPLVDALGADLMLARITADSLLLWRRELETRNCYSRGKSSRPVVQTGLSAWTLRGHIRAARRLFRWLKKNDLIEDEFFDILKLPKLPKYGRRGCSDGDIRLILQEALTSGSEHSKRDFAMLMFLSTTGCRRGGLVNLRMSDLNLDADDPKLRRRVLVREKGDKERVVFLTVEAVKALESWLSVRPRVKSDRVFLARSPGQDWHPIKPDGLSGILRRYAERLGIQGRVNPHEWRHWRARRWLEDGLDLSQVSQLLGHEDVSTTVRFYGQFSKEELQDCFDRTMEKKSR